MPGFLVYEAHCNFCTRRGRPVSSVRAEMQAARGRSSPDVISTNGNWSGRDSCKSGAPALGRARPDNPQDRPFALFYLLDGGGDAHLAASAGLPGGRSPAAVPLLASRAEGRESGPVWPFAAVVSLGDPLVVEDVADRFGVGRGGSTTTW